MLYNVCVYIYIYIYMYVSVCNYIPKVVHRRGGGAKTIIYTLYIHIYYM